MSSPVDARVARIRMLVAARLPVRVSLAELAEHLGCRPEYVSRIFARETGMPLRRWATRLRLAVAADRILAGAPDLGDVALESGFSSHSHLTSAFTRELGITPTELRRRRLRDGAADS